MVSNMSQSALNSSGQSGVWASVRKYKSDLRKNVSASSGRMLRASRTTSMNEELDDAEVKGLLGGYAEAMGKVRPNLGRSVGLAYAVDGKMIGLHVFGSSILFNKLRAQLLRSASVDAAAGDFKKKPASLSVRDLGNFIAAAWDGKKSELKPGMDNVVTRYLAKKTFTSELRYKGSLVHSQVGRMAKIAAMPNGGTQNIINLRNGGTFRPRNMQPRR